MEEFRKTLGTDVYTKRPIQDGGFGFDAITPVAKLFGEAIDVYSTGQKRKADRAKAARELESEAAENDANRLIFELKTSPEFRQIEQYGNAQEAGAMDPAAYRARSEVSLRKLMKRYPRDHEIIMRVIRETGFDSEVFAEFDARQATREAAEQNVIAANTAAYEAAVSKGLDPNTTSRSEMLAEGRNILDTAFEWEMKTSRAAELRAEQEEIRAGNREARAQDKHPFELNKLAIQENNRDLLFNLQKQAAINIPQVVMEINALTQRAAETGATEDLDALQDRINEATRALGDVRQFGISQINSVEGLALDMGVVDGWNAWVDQQLALLEAAQSGPLSARAVTTALLNDEVQANRQRARELAPLQMGLIDIYGGTGVASMVGDSILNSGLIMFEQDGVMVPGALTTETATLLNHFRTLKRVPDVRTLGDEDDPIAKAIVDEIIRPTTGELRSKIARGEGDEADIEAYTTFSRTLLSTIPTLDEGVLIPGQDFTTGMSLTTNQANAFARANFSTENLQAVEAIRTQAPVEAAKLERDMVTRADAVFKSLTTEFGQWSIPLEGELPQGRAPLQTGQPRIESGVFWNSETDTFVGYGGLVDRRKADALNSMLNYIIDYNETYKVMGRVDTLELYVHGRIPKTDLEKAMSSDLSGDN